MKTKSIYLLAALFSFITAPLSAETVKITAGFDYPPFASPNSPGGGFASAIVSRVLQRSGHQVELKWLSWEEGYNASRENKFLGTFPYIKTAEREDLFLYSDVIATSSLSVLMPNTEKAVNSFQDLAGKSACIPLGYAAVPALQEQIDQGKITPFSLDTPYDCLTFMQTNRDVFLTMATHVAVNLLPQYRGTGMHRISKGKTEYHFIISKSHPKAKEWMDEFNKNLAELHSSGEYETIKRNYYPAIQD